MTGHGTLAEEARRLADAFSDWSHDHPVGLAADEGTPETCRYCPLCQLIAVLRGDRPEVGARVAETGAAFLQALRSIVAPEDDRPAPGPPPGPSVEHIDLR